MQRRVTLGEAGFSIGFGRGGLGSDVSILLGPSWLLGQFNLWGIAVVSSDAGVPTAGAVCLIWGRVSIPGVATLRTGAGFD